MENIHLLLVEDEPFIARVIKESLEQRNYSVSDAADGEKGYNLFRNGKFSLCIIDVMLPHVDGFTLAKQIRQIDARIPILFLTAKTATADVVAGYESGGNDYLKKPFSLDELFLRIRELLKRTAIAGKEPEVQSFIGGYKFIPHKQTLQFGALDEIKLSHRETQLLQMLYGHKNALLYRKDVLLILWGDDSYFNARSMDVFITKLRKHLKQDPQVEILNLRGIGYKLIC